MFGCFVVFGFVVEEEKLDKEGEVVLDRVKKNLLNGDVNATVKEYFEKSNELNQLAALVKCIGNGKVTNLKMSDVTQKMIGVACTLPQFRYAERLLKQHANDDPNIDAFNKDFLKKYPLCVFKQGLD